jgi:hypothetical protein
MEVELDTNCCVDKNEYIPYKRAISRDGNRFECDGVIYYVSYNADGLYKDMTYEKGGYMNPPFCEGVKLVRKIDDDDGLTYIKVVGKDYELIDYEAVLCDYDRDWN